MNNEVSHSQSCLTIKQLLSLNCKKRIKEKSVYDYEFHADNLVCPSSERDSSRLVQNTIFGSQLLVNSSQWFVPWNQYQHNPATD